MSLKAVIAKALGEKKDLIRSLDYYCLVRKERLELSRLATLEPKSSVSTNSTIINTPAIAETALLIVISLS